MSNILFSILIVIVLLSLLGFIRLKTKYTVSFLLFWVLLFNIFIFTISRFSEIILSSLVLSALVEEIFKWGTAILFGFLLTRYTENKEKSMILLSFLSVSFFILGEYLLYLFANDNILVTTYSFPNYPYERLIFPGFTHLFLWTVGVLILITSKQAVWKTYIYIIGLSTLVHFLSNYLLDTQQTPLHQVLFIFATIVMVQVLKLNLLDFSMFREKILVSLLFVVVFFNILPSNYQGYKLHSTYTTGMEIVKDGFQVNNNVIKELSSLKKSEIDFRSNVYVNNGLNTDNFWNRSLKQLGQQ